MIQLDLVAGRLSLLYQGSRGRNGQTEPHGPPGRCVRTGVGAGRAGASGVVYLVRTVGTWWRAYGACGYMYMGVYMGADWSILAGPAHSGQLSLGL